MSSRVGSALALTAAVLLAVASLPVGHLVGVHNVSSWWSGHPTIDGQERALARFHIGLIKSAGCYEVPEKHGGGIRECTDDDIKFAREQKRPPSCGCQPVSLALGFRITKYIAFGFAMLLGLSLIGLALARSRQALGKLVLAVAAINAIATIVLLAMGPTFSDGDASVPFGPGLILFFFGTGMSIVAALVALRPARAPASAPGWVAPLPTTPASGYAAIPPAPSPQPQFAFDVQELLQEDALRPSSLGPEPVLGGRNAQQMAVSSPGGVLPGPSGPLGAVTAPPTAQPLFASAPQLRPLYEAGTNVGGTNGLPPIKPPELPTRGPTPLPIAAVNAITGLPPPVAPIPAQPGPKPLPPPLRGKPPSIAPSPPAHGAPPLPAIPRPATPSVPPPFKGSATMMGNAVLPIGVPASIPPIPPVQSPMTKPGGTLAGVLPSRPETDIDDKAETVDFDKQTIDRHSAPLGDAFDAAATEARDPQPTPLDPIDPMLLATGDSTSPSVPFETATNESPSFAHTSTEEIEDLETAAREKISPLDPTDPQVPAKVEPAPRVSAAVLTSAPRQGSGKTTQPPPLAVPRTVTPPIPMPAPTKTATPPSASQQLKVPLSTAPGTLPPPKETKPSATSGPSPACPQCEAPMAWVEEHLRFYCKSCRMYF